VACAACAALAAAPLVAADLGIEVRDKGGRPVQGAAVTIAGPAGATLQGRTSDIGRVVFADLAPGEWGVTIEHPDFMRFAGWVDTKPGKVAKESFSTQVATERSWLPIRVTYFAPASRDAKAAQARPPQTAVSPPPPTARPSPGPAPPTPTPTAAASSRAETPPAPHRASEPIAQPAPAPAPVAAPAKPALPSASPSAAPAPAAAPEPSVASAASAASAASTPSAAPAAPKAPTSAPTPVPAPPPAAATPPVARPREPLTPQPSQAQEQRPEALPAPVAATPPRGAAPAEPSPYRSRALATCPECKPGEWAASAQIATLAGAGCEPGAAARLEAEFSAAVAGVTTGVWSSGEAACRLLAVRLPHGGRFLGYRFEAEDNRRAADCVGAEPCPVGEARFLGHPTVRKGDGPWIWAIFENRAGTPRLARLTAFFAAPPGWQVTSAR
jgi:hypothetical protein